MMSYRKVGGWRRQQHGVSCEGPAAYKYSHTMQADGQQCITKPGGTCEAQVRCKSGHPHQPLTGGAVIYRQVASGR
jgi:hypothetical protein